MEWDHCTLCGDLALGTAGPRSRGTDFPWGISCWGAGSVALLLIIGFYLLLAPCLPLGWNAVLTLLHVVGCSMYMWMLRFDPSDLNVLAKNQASYSLLPTWTALLPHGLNLH